MGWVQCDIIVKHGIYVHEKTWKSHVSTHLTLLRLLQHTQAHISIYPWGCGLTFASNMLRNFDYVLFPHSLSSVSFPCPQSLLHEWKSKKNWEECSTYASHKHRPSMCVFVKWTTFHWILHDFNRFDPFYLSTSFPSSSSGVMCERLCVYNISIHQIWSEIIGLYAMWFLWGSVLTPPHYPVIKIKCVETTRTMCCTS